MLHGYNPDEFWGEKLFFKGATDSTEPEDWVLSRSSQPFGKQL